MSNNKKILAVYSNLPSGGAGDLYSININYLKRFFKIIEIHDPKYRINNFLNYIFTTIYKSKSYQKEIIMRTKHDYLLVYHSWLVKAPYILRYSSSPKIYICHEPMREYYDNKVINTHSIKEKIINILRLPIKLADQRNIKYANSVVSNSSFSRKMIMGAYGLDSEIIMPGINIGKYSRKCDVSKKKQVVSIGSINKLKGQLFLVRVIAKVKQSLRPKLVLICNGYDKSYRKLITLEARKNKVKILILENVSENKKILELKKSVAFMYAPINEPFGIVVEEALASGLPIIADKYGGGYSELLCRKNGFIMDNLSIDDWASALEELLTDHKLQQKISWFNTRYAKTHCRATTMNSKLLKLIKSL